MKIKRSRHLLVSIVFGLQVMPVLGLPISKEEIAYFINYGIGGFISGAMFESSFDLSANINVVERCGKANANVRPLPIGGMKILVSSTPWHDLILYAAKSVAWGSVVNGVSTETIDWLFFPAGKRRQVGKKRFISNIGASTAGVIGWYIGNVLCDEKAAILGSVVMAGMTGVGLDYILKKYYCPKDSHDTKREHLINELQKKKKESRNQK